MSDLLKGEVDWEAKAYGSEYEQQRYIDTDGTLISYQNWTKENTRVVSGPIGNHKFSGRSFPDRPKARAHWKAKAEIVEEYLITGRWAFRIRVTP